MVTVSPIVRDAQSEWDRYFMSLAQGVAVKSKDHSTKVGALIVGTEDNAILTTGWNGFPRGVDDDVPERHMRPAKYLWTEHAERNAIFNAVRRGVPLLHSTLYCTHMPCCDCARAIIQSGVQALVTVEPDWSDPHVCSTQHPDVSIKMLSEAAVSVRFVCLPTN